MMMIALSLVMTTTLWSYRALFFSEEEDWGLVGEWDDRANFVDNDLVRKPLSWALFVEMWRATRVNVYEPLGWLFKAMVQGLAAKEEASGLLEVAARAHRLATLLMHCACACLLFLVTVGLLEQLTKKKHYFPALCGTLMWALHPMHAEVVGWPSAQPYALATCFSLAALLSHLHLLKYQKYYVLGPFFYALATLSKSVTIPLPATVFAIDLLSLRRVKEIFKHLAGYALVTLIMVPVTVRANGLGGDPSADVIRIEGFEMRCAKALITVFFCLGNAIWPINLRPHYVLVPIDTDELQVTLTAAILIVSFSLSRIVAENDFSYSAVLIHVAASFLPSCGLVQHGMIQKGGDRYGYIPLLAIAPVVAAFLIGLEEKTETRGGADPDKMRPDHRRRIHRVLIAMGVAAVVTCESQLTSRQVLLWRNDETLLRGAIEKDPSDWRVLDTLAEHLMAKGDPKQEAPLFIERALRSVELMDLSRSAKETVFRAKNLVLLGKADEGCLLFQEAKIAYPENPMALNNAAICELRAPEQREFQLANFELALARAERPEHERTVATNLQAFLTWRQAGYQGQFDGALLY